MKIYLSFSSWNFMFFMVNDFSVVFHNLSVPPKFIFSFRAIILTFSIIEC